ncbi:hypothetical protein BD410DRAFT_813024 [Rickenella mellea]|uniref:Uncharacterized protein n=1 Tax=Rickenella mellea TaxID=50990 RepID=A0A4Y7QE25_9AGAM|nr:hypothetical protein BD410DRAFT_813024 [Rickenella mellea]
MSDTLATPSPLSTTSVTAMEDYTPIPMSFPTVLLHPKMGDPYARLRDTSSVHTTSSAHVQGKRRNREEKEGKRWVRRKENARFVGNPHIIQASKKDHSLDLPSTRSTFPIPLPPYLSRTASAPSIESPPFDALSASSGRFSLGLKGMRRALRRSGPRTQTLVKDVEVEILEWLDGGTILRPGLQQNNLEGPARLIGCTETIAEVSRNPLELIWAIESDAYARYVVHCCARYHKVVSFSKEVSGRRLTYLLRPNVTRPDLSAKTALDTPPVTDLDYSSHGLESEFETTQSERGALSDIMSEPDSRPQSALSKYSDSEELQNGFNAKVTQNTLEPVEDEDGVEGDEESVVDVDLAQSIGSLSLDVPQRPVSLKITSDRQLHWDRRRSLRSTSSPSRSPSSRPMRRIISVAKSSTMGPLSFYDYLYA